MAKMGFSRTWTLVAATLVALLLATAIFVSNEDAQATTSPVYGKTIVIDPGHGGTDAGARFDGSEYGLGYVLLEKEQNLIVAEKLRDLLVASGATVYLTRINNGTTLSNSERANIANKTGADVLLSIHMNASTNPATNYTTTLFGKWRKDKELANVMFNALANEPGLGISSKAPYSYASGVLLKSNMPATIAETVFITNPEEAARLSDPTGARQQQIAQALKVGIEEYFSTP